MTPMTILVALVCLTVLVTVLGRAVARETHGTHDPGNGDAR